MKNYVKIFEQEESGELDNFDIPENVIDEIVSMVGSEEEVEAAAEEAFNELQAESDAGNLEVHDEAVPERLAISALIVKLVELGKLSQEQADELL